MNDFFSDFFHRYPTKGFLDHQEGLALFRHAKAIVDIGPCLEIGSYCGKSTVYLGQACKEHRNTLYAVDHHRGSEEHQPGEEYHDHELYDAARKRMDSFPVFQRTVQAANLDDCVVPVVASSALALRHWGTLLGLVFIDGGHSPEMAMADCMGWSKKIAPSGILCIHDIFDNPTKGGQGPYLAMRAVLASGDFEVIEQVVSLAILRRLR